MMNLIHEIDLYLIKMTQIGALPINKYCSVIQDLCLNKLYPSC